jgi:hypothetical protein
VGPVAGARVEEVGLAEVAEAQGRAAEAVRAEEQGQVRAEVAAEEPRPENGRAPQRCCAERWVVAREWVRA